MKKSRAIKKLKKAVEALENDVQIIETEQETTIRVSGEDWRGGRPVSRPK